MLKTKPTALGPWLRAMITAVISLALIVTAAGTAAADEPPTPELATPGVTVSAPPTSAYVGRSITIKGAVAGLAGSVKVQAQRYIDGKWRTQASKTIDAAAEGTNYSIGASDKVNEAKATAWRIVASDETNSATSAKFYVKRTAPKVSFKTSDLRRVGQDVTASGTLTGFSGSTKLRLQVYHNGEWYTQAKTTVKASEKGTSYKLVDKGGIDKTGTKKWRVVANAGKVEAKSSKISVKHVPTRKVTASATRSLQVGSNNYASGTVRGYTGTVKVKAQVYNDGEWQTKETKTIKASYDGTSYDVALPYGVNSAGTKTWRIVADDGSNTSKSSSFKVTRVSAKLDSRCLTGRALCISKEDRKLRWVIDGAVKKTLDVRFGSPKTPTRNGAHQVNWKSRDHVSSLYHSAMPFAMFFSGGQAVHYSADFARNGYYGASHGCVNVRDYNGIKKLFDEVRVGDKVIVY